jgi:hypothetical protein
MRRRARASRGITTSGGASRLRDRGATLVQYIGVLAMISGIAGGLVVSGVGERVADACAVAVCRAFGGDCRLTGGETTGETTGEEAAASGAGTSRQGPAPQRRGAGSEHAPPRPPIVPPACGPNPNGAWTDGLHSHNDYQNRHSLDDALDHGATSVEVDVMMHDGELVLRHHDEEPRETLRDYVDRLRARADQNGGVVYPGRDKPFEIYLEVKNRGDDAAATQQEAEAYRRAMEEFERLPPGVEVVVDPGSLPLDAKVNPPPGVTFAITPGPGCTLPPELDPTSARYDRDYARKHTMFNGSYRECADTNGDFQIDDAEQQRFNALVRQIHTAGYKVRIVEGPDGRERDDDSPGSFRGCPLTHQHECGEQARRNWWQAQLQAGVDYLDTQHLTRGQEFLRSCGQSG